MKIYLTSAGQALLYKAQGGKQLNFTRFGLGDGLLNGQAIQELTHLISEKMASNVTKLEVKNNKVVLGMSFNNTELLEGFYFRELGLFAEDPDTKAEVLYMYGNSGETSDYIDSNTGRVIEENLDIEICISNVDNISAVIDGSLVYASYQDLENLKMEIGSVKKDYALIDETGYELALNIDSNTYVMTLELKNKKGSVLSTKTIDFPLETMVIGASYAAGVLTLTLKNGTTTQIDISALVSGLVADSRTIAGVDLKDDISKAELLTALGISNTGIISQNVITNFWVGTQTQYDALSSKNANTEYNIYEEE